MKKTLHGKIHGRTTQLYEDPGVAGGQEVEVHVSVVVRPTEMTGDGFRHTEGALADDDEWDAIMDEIYNARHKPASR